MNSTGMYYLARREIHRFLKVINQTVFPPIVSALIYIVIFRFVISGASGGTAVSTEYLQFLIPGLVMMSMINNAFQNSSSSIFISKFTHHFKHILTMPLSFLELTLAYVLGGVVRGLITGLGIIIATAFFIPFSLHNAFIALLFFLFATVAFSSLGILIALWAEQFDHLGIFGTFFLTPLTMLGGVFYSIQALPQTYQTLSMFNPIFYLVDGFRYGILGLHDSPLWLALLVSTIFATASFGLILWLLKNGWKVKE